MSELTCRQVYTVGRSEVRSIDVDFGENTAGQETRALKAGDTLTSATVSVADKPSGASDPTLTSPVVNSGTVYVNGRACSAGECVTFKATMGAGQTLGRYVLLVAGVTTNGETIRRRLLLDVGAE